MNYFSIKYTSPRIAIIYSISKYFEHLTNSNPDSNTISEI